MEFDEILENDNKDTNTKTTSEEEDSAEDFSCCDAYEPALVAVEDGVRRLFHQETVNRHFILFALKCVVDQLNDDGLIFPKDIIFYMINLFFIDRRVFKYVSDFDTNGFLYWLGLQEGTLTRYVNPVELGLAFVNPKKILLWLPS
jgi:hypothetical protein